MGEETRYWLELLVEAKLLPASRRQSLLSETDERIAILVSAAKGAKRRQ